MKNLEVTTKAGKIELVISGNNEYPKVVVADSTILAGMNISGSNVKPSINRSKQKGVYIKSGRGIFVENELAYFDLKNSISQLPNPPERIIEKTKKIINADGDIIETSVWDLGYFTTTSGTVISGAEMSHFLDSKKIEKIEESKAIKLFETEREEDYIAAEKRSIKRMKDWAVASDGNDY